MTRLLSGFQKLTLVALLVGLGAACSAPTAAPLPTGTAAPTNVPTLPAPTETAIPTSAPTAAPATATTVPTAEPTSTPANQPSLTALPALSVNISSVGLAVDGAGNLYLGECGSRVLKVDTAGLLTIFAGIETDGFSGDNGPAILAELACANTLAVGVDGSVYVSDSDNNRVRRVGPDGIITTIAGNGPLGWREGGFAGDGGLATEAILNYPTGVALDNNGNLYFVDHLNVRIRKVDLNGMITTIAGTGRLGTVIEGSLAIDSPINTGVLAVDGDGTVYFGDSGRVRQIDLNGILTTIAGGGQQGFAGDGGPATEALLTHVNALAVDAEGNLFIADENRIRRVDREGIITTIAGGSSAGFSGDEGPATQALFDWCGSMAFDAQGNLYVTDYNNHRIRKIDTTGIITTVAGGG